jgi:hypothetical protein
MGVVPALLTVDDVFLIAVDPTGLSGSTRKLLCDGPALDQGAIHNEAILRQQAALLGQRTTFANNSRTTSHFSKRLQLFFDGRVGLYGIVGAHPAGLADQQFVLRMFH